ncbi:MAG: glycosyl hydrolase [Chitinophagaceae bacterium]
MTKLFLIYFLGTCFLLSNNQVTCQVVAGNDKPADKKATKETIALYGNLKKLLNKGFMFGHQDDLAYGVNWKYEEGRSDIKDVTGDYPAVYGWELGHLEIDQPVNLDSVPFTKMQHFIRQAYDRGGVVTISWHLNNPLTAKSAWNPAEGTVASILPGGQKHDLYKSWLDKVVIFLNGLKGSKGEFIPVIFRPFHELNGNWFWWGGKNCTPEEFKNLWKFTISYLRDQKNVHHLLYAYNTDRYNSSEEYLAKYPGNDYVDVIGFDIYQRNGDNGKYVQEIDKMLSTLEVIASENKKIPALTEFGGNLSDSSWWTGIFLKVLGGHKISYALGWRNAGKKAEGQFEFYVPYKGHLTENDFMKFYKSGKTLFQKDVTPEKLYHY